MSLLSTATTGLHIKVNKPQGHYLPMAKGSLGTSRQGWTKGYMASLQGDPTIFAPLLIRELDLQRSKCKQSGKSEGPKQGFGKQSLCIIKQATRQQTEV
eukprot:6183905-Pleurochrysis_carterae.AAC.1